MLPTLHLAYLLGYIRLGAGSKLPIMRALAQTVLEPELDCGAPDVGSSVWNQHSS